ncbi:hypothetical protein GPECTOR_105g107 [Gonium pectorale]|uniref:N-acetyltransferase domain-containing protein n=1 Tax=Gonium pectorale TaxID=33097 RepID=A0A150FZK7_GONPE|nr:hypothetical protein GPECTOR_105g107 [Gonium pectorale]|eukprot:KXZ43053.1 hypothetical protein GPECTOR_105g107 [Gonium pectorale]
MSRGNRLEEELHKLRGTVEFPAQGTFEFVLLPPFGLDVINTADHTRFTDACELLTKTFPNNAKQIKWNVYRGRSPKNGSRVHDDPTFYACLLAGVWLGDQVVCAASLRLNLPKGSERWHSHVQTVYQATRGRYQKQGLGRLLTRCIMQAAAKAGHEYATVVIMDRSVEAYWTNVGFAPTGHRDEHAVHLVVHASERHAGKSGVWVMRLDPPGAEQEEEEAEVAGPGAQQQQPGGAALAARRVREAYWELQVRLYCKPGALVKARPGPGPVVTLHLRLPGGCSDRVPSQ